MQRVRKYSISREYIAKKYTRRILENYEADTIIFPGGRRKKKKNSKISDKKFWNTKFSDNSKHLLMYEKESNWKARRHGDIQYSWKKSKNTIERKNCKLEYKTSILDFHLLTIEIFKKKKKKKDIVERIVEICQRAREKKFTEFPSICEQIW